MSKLSGPRLPDRSGSLVDLFDPSRVIVTDPLMLMCDDLAVRGGGPSTGEDSRAVKWCNALCHTALAQDVECISLSCCGFSQNIAYASAALCAARREFPSRDEKKLKKTRLAKLAGRP